MRDSIACYVKYYPELDKEDSRKLEQQVFASSWRYLS